MTDARWDRIERVFEEALDQPESGRAAWVREQCRDDSTIGDEVLRLLDAHARTEGILDRDLPALIYDMTDHLQRALRDRYRIERPLGHGGSAIVFVAHEQKHVRRVVLKVLKPEIATILGTERFLREVQIAARLAHPHILGLIDSGNADGLLFYVMPYVEGETLRARLRRGPLNLGDVRSLLHDMADALAYAHRAGVVHRDLKPENVLCVGGHAFLMDFGIAKVLSGTEGYQHVTDSGASIGTPAYMAPEQAAGDPETDQRADIYAWGLLAQEMLTGRTPGGVSARSGEPRQESAIDTMPRGTPVLLVDLLADCLSADPVHRVRTMNDVLTTLDDLVTPQPGKPVAPRRRTRTRRWVAAAAAVIVVVTAAFLLAPRDPSELPLPVAVAALTNETGDSTLGTWGRLAGDWITQGLQETGRVSVVPWPSAAQATDLIAAETREGAPNIVARMRGETRAGTVVTGAYYLIGDSVRFQVEVSNALTGRLLGALTPVTAHREQPEAAIRELRARLMGQMAVWSDERIATIPGFANRPPTFEAYRLFDHGLQLYIDQEYRNAAAEFRRAQENDTSFVVAMIYEALCRWNTGQHATVDSLLAHLKERRAALSDFHTVQIRVLEAMMVGDRPRALVAQRRATEIAPESKAGYNLAHTALEMNRPAEALAALQSVDPDRGSMRGWSPYWTALAHANHLLGDHKRELDAARGMRTRFPDRRVGTVLEARALAAAGRTAELDSLLTAIAELPPRTYWSQGAAMEVAGEELLVHRDSAKALEYFERARQWFVERRKTEPDYAAHREWLALALYGMRRWGEAAEVLEPFVQDTNQRYSLRTFGMLAAYRAKGGPVPELPPVGPIEQGERFFYLARVASAAGDTTRALDNLSEAMRLGMNGFAWVHGSAHHDLAPLAGDPRYQRIMTADASR